MNRVAAVALVACTHATAPVTTSNTAPQSATDADVTHMIVQLNEYYDDMCKVQHHVAIAMDGVQVLVLASKLDCPVPHYSPTGGRIVVTSSGPNGYVEGTFAVPRGHHVFVATDLETHATARAEGDFPMYQAQGARVPMDHFGLNVDDKEFHVLGFSLGFLSM